MAKVLIIGAGGVGNVVTHKCAQIQSVFSEILLASRTKEKCDAIAASVDHPNLSTAQVNADQSSEVSALIKDFQPDIVINVALPYQDLPIMDACLEMGVNYLDTANYEPPDEAKFEYKWQWAYHERYKQAGLTAILGCGFDPGVTGVFTAYALKHYFDEIHYLDIVDCNAGNHGQAFATNFNPEINIREITQNGRYYKHGDWVEVEPFAIHRPIHYPEIGPRESYLLYHEELESLVKNVPTIKRARFWMTFSESYINHLKVLENVGLTRIEPIEYEGQQIVPLQFLKAVLPQPSSLGQTYEGQTSIGCHIRGIKDGQERSYYVYNNCDHAEAFKEVGAQAIAYTTGVPAMIGALLVATGEWQGAGVFNVEQMNPDPFMEKLGTYGLPWHEVFDASEFTD
ncbi:MULTISPECIES: saccharopine dehydrogenase family protein [unclassified Leptolyngbya]|uniref:saccharopine dehydrogenase family protein n=1 Tax=unclassified Leptolyngbya TaxID=2650499 RepID=UPI00168819AD|nr:MULTISPECIES: saccharopine dehydrogenase family protein [unclassified Leptolyngbya]MBD1909944.1 saccharopine dehydrogenase family protein [Leptolyngbya sp. FACHB-8]MBD2154947.1 saccharopine dehydrogenase family protein [Leptolyngbya sp. FACHB-16]